MTRAVLLTRPAAESARMTEAVENAGFTPIVSPALTIEDIPCDWPAPEAFQGLIVTSAQALRHVPPVWFESGLPVYAVGDHTATVATARGFLDVRAAGGDAVSLQTMMEAATLRPDKGFFHPCGRHLARAINLPVPVLQCPVYEAVAATCLSDDCLTHLDAGTVEAALFFSPRSGRIIADLLEKYRRTDAVKTIKALCFSESVVKSIRHLPWANVRQANRPHFAAMMGMVRSLRNETG